MHRSLWRHFAILSLIVAVYAIGGGVLGWHSQRSHITWSAATTMSFLQAPGWLVWYSSLVAGIAVGTARVGARSMRSALLLLGALLSFWIVVDMWVDPAMERAGVRAAKAYGGAWPFVGDTIIRSSRDTNGLIRTAAYLLRERPAALHEKLGASWSQDHPRELATEVAIRLPNILLPFITMGLVLGMVSWQRRRLIFRTPRDEFIARWCSSWVLAAAAWSMVLGFGDHYSIQHHIRPYWWPLFLRIPFLIMAALGWRAAARATDVDDDIAAN